MNTLYRRLSSAGVTLSIRRGVLRFSVGVFNNTDDVDQVIEIARA